MQTKFWKNILCFVNSAAATTKLAFFLKTLSKKRIKVGHLSANLSIKERNSVLEEFSKEKIDM